MLIGSILLVIALLVLLYDTAYLSKAKNYGSKKQQSTLLVGLALVLIFLSYGLFVQAFLSNDFSLDAVYSYSSSGLSALSKLYATWSGSSGSLLFLVFTMAIVYSGYRLKTARSNYRFKSLRDRSVYDKTVYLGFDVTLVFFLLLTLVKNPFESTGFIAAEGKGLNPALQSPWMAVHPPIVFFAYAFILLAFFLVLARVKSGEKRELLLKTSIFAAWALMTLGILLGAVWAYEVLGWGGYWSWDPIETGSLLPWLALTAYFFLHSVIRTKNKMLKDFTILIAVLSLFFLSALTRGGLLESVHAYGFSPAGPLLLLFSLGMAAYFFFLKSRTHEPKVAFHIDKSSLNSVSAFIVCFSLGAIFLVCFAGIAIPIVQQALSAGTPNLGSSYYELWNYPFALILAIGIAGFGLSRKISLRTFGAITISVVVVGFALVVVGWPTSAALVNFGTPTLLLSMGAAGHIAFSALNTKDAHLPKLSKGLLYLGILIVLMGYFFSSGAKQTFVAENIKPNTPVEIAGMKIQVENSTFIMNNDTVQLEDTLYCECSSARMNAYVSYEGQQYNFPLWVKLYPVYGIIGTPEIISTPTKDIYVHTYPTESLYNSLVQAYSNQEIQPESLTIAVEFFPYIYLIWIGSIILLTGILLVMVEEFFRKT